MPRVRKPCADLIPIPQNPCSSTSAALHSTKPCFFFLYRNALSPPRRPRSFGFIAVEPDLGATPLSFKIPPSQPTNVTPRPASFHNSGTRSLKSNSNNNSLLPLPCITTLTPLARSPCSRYCVPYSPPPLVVCCKMSLPERSVQFPLLTLFLYAPARHFSLSPALDERLVPCCRCCRPSMIGPIPPLPSFPFNPS
jgi:hypothetical protein